MNYHPPDELRALDVKCNVDRPKTENRICQVCSIPYRGRNTKYCSIDCCNRDKRVEKTCANCGVVFSAMKCHVKRGQMKYCSHACFAEAITTSEVTYYQGVKYIKNYGGYFEDKDGKKLHRVVWESHFGQIPQGHLIHHKDENKANNNISNLELMEWGEHTRVHHALDINDKTVKERDFNCLACGVNFKRICSEESAMRNKYCGKKCANSKRERNANGTYV